MDQIELIEKRKPREKHFLQKDGTIRAEVYGEDVHYLKDGKYEEIDNTLIEEKGVIVNKSNDFHVEFQENYNDSLFRITKKDHYIDFQVKNVEKASKLPSRKISPKEKNIISTTISDDITIEHKILSNKVKETIVLKNGICSRFCFELNTNLKLKEDNGEVLALDDDNKVIFHIEKPFMYDAKNNYCNDIKYFLYNQDGKECIDLILNEQWLNDENRIFPVYVDPTISINSNNLSFQDTYIYPGDTNDNNGNKSYLKAGVELINNNLIPNRTLIKFSLPVIGTGSEIVYASLDLIPYPTFSANPTPRIATIHQITSDWNESNAKWNNMNNQYNNKVESIFYGQRSIIENNVVIPSGSFYDGNITNIVKKWYRDLPNYGLMIKTIDETTYVDDDYPIFYSKDNSIINNNPKPIVNIVYRNHNGLEKYLDYKEQGFSLGNAYVNTFNGNLTTQFNVGHTIGGKLPINLNIIYNTNDVVLNKETFFKKGFKLNYEQTIKCTTINNDEYLEYEDEDGTIHYFKYNQNNEKYEDEDGLGLFVNKTNTTCTMIDNDSNTLVFDKVDDIYRLSSINNYEGDSCLITFNQDNSINKIVDKYNNEVRIDYHSEYIDIISPDATTTLNYSNNLLSSIETISGTISFDYNNGLIDTITDMNGIKTKYDYYNNNPFRVKKVTRIGLNNTQGEFFNLDYGFNSTCIVNSDGRTITLIFNSYGNVLSKNSLVNEDEIDNAYSLSMVVSEEGNHINRILSKDVPIKYIKNYIKNASFESNIIDFIIDSNINSQFDTDYYNSGLRSLKLISYSSNKKITQTIDVPKGEYYTFSGYFKNTGKVKISLSYYNQNNEIVSSDEIISSNDSFERSDVTIYYDENATSDLIIDVVLLEIETIYIDDIQLEKGEVANSFNLIENSDFSNGYSEWDLYGWTYDDSPINVAESFSIANFNNNHNKALKVSVNPTYGVRFTKTIPVKGKAGDLYTCSFWYKNQGYPGYGRTAGSEMSIYYKPIGEDAQYCIATSGFFNPNDDKWQFYTYKSRAPEDFESISIVFLIGREANDFYLTNMSLYKDVAGNEYIYDEYGNLTNIKDQSNNVNIFKYNNDNQLISMINNDGKNFKYEYDNQKKSKLLSSISSSGIASDYYYNNDGNIISKKISKKYSNNIENGLYKIRNKGSKMYLKSALNTVILEKNDCSNTVWQIEQVQNKYKIKYALHPTFSISCRNGIACLDEDDSNNLFEIESNTQSSNGTFFIKYSEETGYGTVIKFLTVNGNGISFEIFDSLSSNIEFYIELDSQLFKEINATYTANGRFLESITDSDMISKYYSYNTTSGLISSITNPNGKNTIYQYNNKNQLSRVTYEGKYVDYEYNAYNLLSKIIQGNKTYNLVYDTFHNLSSVNLNNTIALINNTYNSSCQLLKSVFKANDEINYNYDSFGRLSNITKMNDVINYYYGTNGYISKVVTGNNTMRYYYDTSGKLYKYKDNDYKLINNYNSSDAIIKKSYLVGDNYYDIDIIYANDLPIKLKYGLDEVNYTYDELDRVISKNINNNIIILYSYKKNGKKTTDKIESYKVNNNEYTFNYDLLGNIVSIFLNNTLCKEYVYDDYGQLTIEYNHDDDNYIEYIYNSSGNLTQYIQKKISDDSTIEEHFYLYSNVTWEDQLTSYDNNQITYDTIGNITQYKNYTYEWINGRELNRIINSSNNSIISYKYNHKGKRIGKTINNNETKYYLEDNRIIFEEKNNNLIYYLYDLDGIVGLQYNNQKYYYEKNALNDIIGIVDSLGNRIVKYKYDVWGKILSIKDNNDNEITNDSHIGIINPFRYRSYYYDEESGMYYLGKRYYNPEINRFISPDTILGANQDVNSNNLYLYVSNNPVNNTDYDGNFLVGFILGNLISSAIKTAIKSSNSKKASNTKNKNKEKKKNIVGITTSNTVQTNFSIGGLITKSLWFGVEPNRSKTYTSNVLGEDSVFTIDFNNTNFIDNSVSISTKTPIGDISYSLGFGGTSLRIEKEYDEEGNRNIFGFGSDMLSFYVEDGYDTYINDNKYTTTSNKIVFSKVMVALAVLAVVGEVPATVGILVKAVA